MPSNRMHRGLAALSASAVAAIYLAGFVRTEPADAGLSPVATETPVATTPAATPTGVASTAAPARAASATATPAPARAASAAATPASQTTSGYKDGTYTGQDVWVQVQVMAGRIANVTITRSTLQYPLRDIAGLPQQVVQRQTAQVDLVSRATYSSMAFRGAVSQALASATAA
ncbi:MAG: FMN-binding protein [Chloroflexi bacterium]|nr:MAG: FMN-binding protein [Chloroflexota bacterium]